MFKCIHGLDSPQLCNDIEMFCERHNHHTRNNDSLNVVPPEVHLSIVKQAFKFAGAKRWNGIPHFIQNAQTIETF